MKSYSKKFINVILLPIICLRTVLCNFCKKRTYQNAKAKRLSEPAFTVM